MGVCFSAESLDYSYGHQKPSANVVLLTGELSRYSLPVTAAQVLQSQPPSAAADSDSFFLCNSDRLSFEEYIPPLDLDDELEPAQIYFLLPKSKLQYRLSASDMAALAVKASVALEQINGSSSRRRRRARISPVVAVEENPQSTHTVGRNIKSPVDHRRDRSSAAKSPAAALGVSRSGSVKKFTRFSSRRAKLAVRSFRNKLSTIYEGSVLLVA